MTAQDLRLEHLTAHAQSTAWVPDHDIDWTQPVRRPRWLSGSAYAGLISQMMYGEQLSHDLIAGPLGQGESAGETRFLKSQAADEARHVLAYQTYLESLGDIAPRETGFACFAEQVKTYDGPSIAIDLAIHAVLEGDALMLQKNLQDWLPCPLLRALNQRISRDESRHVSFGKAVLPGRIARLSADEKAYVAHWLEETWRSSFHALAGRFASPIVLNRRRRDDLADRFWQPHVTRLTALGLIGEAT